MTTKPTPGPWKYREPNFDSFSALAKSQRSDPKKLRIDYVPVYVNGGSEVCRIVHEPADGFDLISDRDEHEANAALISAAPDLLAALELLVSIFDGKGAGTNVDGKWMGVPDWEQVDIARSAIARAKGEA